MCIYKLKHIYTHTLINNCLHVYLIFFFHLPIKNVKKIFLISRKSGFDFSNRIASPYIFHPKSSLHSSQVLFGWVVVVLG